MKEKFTNNLIKETSPYLLQHAHNPVHWEAWHPEVLQRAKKENKLLLISIGYAACHWCHVMEHECFENEEVADTMNSHFVNIKIDREERPDIDHIYMDALQMMTGAGGWPLNIVALPDGRPFWGATFVKQEAWIQVLQQLGELYETDPSKIIGYAENMEHGLIEINTISTTKNPDILKTSDITEIIKDWSTYFDTFFGGYKRAPKFMMPVNLNFLLHYAISENNVEIQEYLNTTLTRMAWGGIFDHVGGGFSRYSVDTKWHVPHFEKMLYDNGLLISLYAKAYAATGNELYKNTVQKTISFLEEELLHKNGAFYSSLDADSLTSTGKLVEGAYYVWQEQQLKELLSDDFEIFKTYFNINSYGFWEHDNYVLIRDGEQSAIAAKFEIPKAKLIEKIESCLKILKKERSKRKSPRLDDKILTSWNGLALTGLTNAYKHLGTDRYLVLAQDLANFILNNLIKEDGSLYHNFKNGKGSITGFLEDYAAVIQGFLGLYEATADEKWLQQSVNLSDYVLNHFTDLETGLFFFTSDNDEKLIRRTLEIADNVIPSSNSIMAHNLFLLSKYYPENGYQQRLETMLSTMDSVIKKNPQSHANWLHLSLVKNERFYEIAIVGEKSREISGILQKNYLPNVIFAASKEKSELPLLKERYVEGKTLIYICQEGACQLPTEKTHEALKLIKAKN
ncbi:thioredoxin domain-containing protein [Maribacter sp. X9]|uniref:thioredoxin domain-containing protein n=1 Tax=Maribacter sp. X9 TaxID=3402159 RepID=UPI003AF33C52